VYLCITESAGVLTGTEVSSVAACTQGYIAVSSAEYSDLPSLTQIFTIPVTEDLQQMWMIGFALPVICYLTAWAYQSVISWFEKGGFH
jgi:hypothetical protein